MIRALILMGFTYFFYYLYASGDNAKYINMKYEYINILGMILFAVLTTVQIFNIAKGEPKIECDCGHDHEHEQDKPWWKRILLYALFAFPLVTGLGLPIATLDSTVVRSKGFSFQSINTLQKGDQFIKPQYLKPDTSVFFAKDGYLDLMKQELDEFSKMDPVALNDNNFLMGMETLYNFPGDFEGKTVSYKGFIYHGEDHELGKNQVFVLRFGVIHCIADAGVYGMLVQLPGNQQFKNDQWVNVEGKLSTIYYQPFRSNIPYLKVTKIEETQKPEEPYTFRGYDNPNVKINK
ncbi:TIGR03943 family putative permease subunit [Rummeliibacillus pycnus]|uniref:TIGR03943 family putative permease subunit n=1 Tax=Rummeliibacillus pycnus TaxID=101070 RepID=UPI000C9AFE21|nr:TIGR03943 family protein [Rummeliibacillus pycnus]